MPFAVWRLSSHQLAAYPPAPKGIYSKSFLGAQSANGGQIMRSGITAIFSVILLFGAGLAQQTSTPAPDTQTPRSDEQPSHSTQAGAANANAPNSLKIAPGSVLPVQLTKTVDAKKAKTGDEVVATVTQDMKANSGEVLVPKDTKIIGHVTEAQARNKEQKQSELGIAFDHAMVKGDQMQLPMSIQAIIAPQNNNSEAAAPGPGPSAGPAQTSGNAQGGSMGAGRTSSAGGGSQQSGQQNYPQGGGAEAEAQASAQPPITANTQGVIGMSDVKLENGAQSQQGSVLSSEKNNVKIEKGTMMLLRVNQAQ
jgi:hypothetical protein